MGIALPTRLPALPRIRLPWPAWLRRPGGFDAVIAGLAVAAFAAGPWFAERPSRATATATAAINGDSLRAGDLDVRLLGIDAPELRQTCHDTRGRAWPCGQTAKIRLAALIARGEISCTVHGYDRYRRALAVCSAGDVADLGETLVREGHAIYSGGVTSRYTAAEAQARAEQRGIWHGAFDLPQQWRASHRRRQTTVLSGMKPPATIAQARRSARIEDIEAVAPPAGAIARNDAAADRIAAVAGLPPALPRRSLGDVGNEPARTLAVLNGTQTVH